MKPDESKLGLHRIKKSCSQLTSCHENGERIEAAEEREEEEKETSFAQQMKDKAKQPQQERKTSEYSSQTHSLLKLDAITTDLHERTVNIEGKSFLPTSSVNMS